MSFEVKEKKATSLPARKKEIKYKKIMATTNTVEAAVDIDNR